MALFHDSAIAGASGNQGGGVGYQISRSLRFNSSDSAFLSRNVSSETNRKTFTFAAWVKRNKLGSGDYYLFHGVGGSGGLAGYTLLGFSADQLWFNDGFSGAITSTAKFRDPSAWYHVVFAVDSTQATDSNRVKMYVNGVQLTSLNVVAWPSLNRDFTINAAVQHTIGWYFSASNDFLLADIHFIDGQALTPSSFTEVSATTGQLIPKAYTGSFGTNGFWLKFSDNSAATATTLGKDYSGNNNNWSPSNLSVLSSYTDTFLSRKPDGTSWTNPTYAFDGTTANYADGTYNNGTVSTIRFNKPLTGVTLLEYFYDGTSTYGYNSTDVGTGPNLTGGSWVTVYSGSAITVNNVRCTSQPGNGVIRLYAIRVNGTILNNWTETDPPGCDSTVDTPSSAGTDTGLGGEVTGNYCTLNPLNRNSNANLSNGNLNFSLASAGVNYGTFATFGVRTGKWYFEASIDSFISYGITTGFVTSDWGRDYIGSGGTAYFGLDTTQGRRSSAGITASGSTVTYAAGDVVGVAFNADAGTATIYKNGASVYTFSGIPANDYFPALSSGGSSAWINFGQRQWAYAAPAGFKALCDTSLPAPVVAKPSTVMDVKLYTGNGSTQTISGLGFSPDFVWLKMRSTAGYSHKLVDTVRGATISLVTNNTNAELTEASGLTAFTSDGFSLGSQEPYNRNSDTFVAWAFDAGTTTTTNTAGSITSQVRTNGYLSIVSYTGTGANATVGHGLNVAPSLVIVKRRNSTSNWLVWNSVIAASNAANVLFLDTTDAALANSTNFNSTSPTSTVFTVGTNAATNASGGTHVAYCFSPVTGYSSFGSYTGNGSADGPFVFTGMRPRWIMWKCTTAAYDWDVYDAVRDPYNAAAARLKPNSSDAEATLSPRTFDILSNGFKLREGYNSSNASSQTYIYAAFAESPFQYARAR